LDLLEATIFSLETAEMALGVPESIVPDRILSERISGTVADERSAALVAVEALESARAAYVQMATLLDDPERESAALVIRFWSTLDSCWNSLFANPPTQADETLLHKDLIRAVRRTHKLRRAVLTHLGPIRSH
jgi:hypothetical protein